MFVQSQTSVSCCISTRRDSETVFWFCVIKQFNEFLLLVSFPSCVQADDVMMSPKTPNHQRLSDPGSVPD